MNIMHIERSSRWHWVAAGLLSAMLQMPTVVLACEACKEAVKDDPVGTALSATTLVLIAMPMLLIGSIGGWVSYVYWRAARHAGASDGASASQPV
jgi:hypothetical protein